MLLLFVNKIYQYTILKVVGEQQLLILRTHGFSKTLWHFSSSLYLCTSVLSGLTLPFSLICCLASYLPMWLHKTSHAYKVSSKHLSSYKKQVQTESFLGLSLKIWPANTSMSYVQMNQLISKWMLHHTLEESNMLLIFLSLSSTIFSYYFYFSAQFISQCTLEYSFTSGFIFIISV